MPSPSDLGIEVVDVALMGLHPPVEAAADYLDVISARIDADRVRVEALGETAVQIGEGNRRDRRSRSPPRGWRPPGGRARRYGESSQFVAIGKRTRWPRKRFSCGCGSRRSRTSWSRNVLCWSTRRWRPDREAFSWTNAARP